MPQETIVKPLDRELGAVKDAPSVAPQQSYIFENGTPYTPPETSEDHPLVPDQGFDGPA